eukprot:7827756-Pyramimonas_sp.AAC.1
MIIVARTPEVRLARQRALAKRAQRRSDRAEKAAQEAMIEHKARQLVQKHHANELTRAQVLLQQLKTLFPLPAAANDVEMQGTATLVLEGAAPTAPVANAPSQMSSASVAAIAELQQGQ